MNNETPVTVEKVLSDIQSLPEEERQQVVMASASITQYSGPLPPPEMLYGYNQVIPGSAERILKMAEKNLELQEIDVISVAKAREKQADMESRNSLVASIIALLVTVILLSLGVYLIIIGKELSGIVTALAAFSPIILSFLRKSKD